MPEGDCQLQTSMQVFPKLGVVLDDTVLNPLQDLVKEGRNHAEEIEVVFSESRVHPLSSLPSGCFSCHTRAAAVVPTI